MKAIFIFMKTQCKAKLKFLYRHFSENQYKGCQTMISPLPRLNYAYEKKESTDK